MVKSGKRKLVRQGHTVPTEGDYIKGIVSQLVDTGSHHETFLKKIRGGVEAMKGAITHGGEEHKPGPDAIAFAKKFDPSNTSGAVKDAMDIMEKFKESVKSGNLSTAMQPIQNILGGQLYGAMSKAISGAKSGGKIQKTKKPTPDIIALLIRTAEDKLTPEDHIEAADLLDENEIQLITQAYYGNGIYTSGVEIATFVAKINELIPVFRKAYGTKAQGVA